MSESKISRRDMLKSLGGISLASLAGRAQERTTQQTRPNIIYIMTDDHATHALSCYGSRINETPNLDRIANEGMRFDNCFVTNSLCAPSRATILTGKYSHLHGQETNADTFDGSQQTFPKLVQDVGYNTAVVGKWHLRSDPTGFDYWNVLPGQGRYFNPDFIENGVNRNYSGYVTDIITDLAIDYLENRDPNAPFFLSIGHKAPHRGWQPRSDYEDMYEEYSIPEPETFYDDYYDRASPAAHANMRIADMPDYSAPSGLSETEVQQYKYQQFIKDYLRTIASVDDNVGRLLDYLDANNLADNTVVVYTTDNGFFLGDHGWFDKRFMYEESLRIPLLVRYPREIPGGSVRDEMVLNLDFAETLLDYAETEIPSDMQGRSLRPLLRGEEATDWRQSVYYHYYEYPGPHTVRPQYGVRTQRYKLIHYYTIDEWELFDLDQDPHEMHNIYDEPDYQMVVNQLKNELQDLRSFYNEPEAAIATGLSESTPEGFALSQNYPNPFNGETQIDFRIPESTEVRVEIFNPLGQKVTELVNGTLNAGRHSFIWDAANQRVASGTYVCRVTSPGIEESIRMSYVK